jgi:hypothetical protein
LNITSPSAPAASRLLATLPKAVKNGESFTATGMRRTRFNSSTMSWMRVSIAMPGTARSVTTS